MKPVPDCDKPRKSPRRPIDLGMGNLVYQKFYTWAQPLLSKVVLSSKAHMLQATKAMLIMTDTRKTHGSGNGEPCTERGAYLGSAAPGTNGLAENDCEGTGLRLVTEPARLEGPLEASAGVTLPLLWPFSTAFTPTRASLTLKK